MPFDIKAAVKKPWVKYGLIAVGFIGVFYILYSRNSASAATGTTGTSDTGPNDAAIAQTQIAASAGAASQDSSQSFQLAQQSEADKTNLAAQAASIAGQLGLNSDNNTTSIALGNIQLQGLAAQLKEATDVAGIQANEQTHISDNQTAVSLGQTNAAAGVAKTQSNNGVKSGLITAGVGLIAAFF